MSPPEFGSSKPNIAAEFREELADEPADERVYRVAQQLYESDRIAEIAERADCAPDTARRHLARLAEIGVIERTSNEPVTYRRNESYFEWRERARLEDESMDELRDQLAELSDRERTFRERYDAECPEDVDALAHADYDAVDDVWLDLSEWSTVRQRIERLETIRKQKAADSASSGSEAA